MRRTMIVVCLSLLAACDRPEPPAPAPGDTQPRTALGRTVDRAMDEARRKLATENISLKDGIRIDIDGSRFGSDLPADLPDAAITPQGELLVAGKPVEIDARQRQLLLDYRAAIVDIAETGMDLGVQGADLGMQAAGEAIAGIFGGDAQGVEKRIEAEAEKIKASARALCAQLPALLASQDALAAALPAFAPYARMDRQDIDDCRIDGDGHARDDRAEIRDGVRDGIRRSVQAAAQGAGLAGSDAAEATPPADDAEAAATE